MRGFETHTVLQPLDLLMNEQEKKEIKEAIEIAVAETIELLGYDFIRTLSWFPSAR